MSIDGHSWSEELTKPRAPSRPHARSRSFDLRRPTAAIARAPVTGPREDSKLPPPRRGGVRESAIPRDTMLTSSSQAPTRLHFLAADVSRPPSVIARFRPGRRR